MTAQQQNATKTFGGVGLCVAIAIELGDLKGAKDSFAKLPSDLDLRLAFQRLGIQRRRWWKYSRFESSYFHWPYGLNIIHVRHVGKEKSCARM